MTIGARVWEQVCRHIDGVAIGSTMAALHERGGLDALAASSGMSMGALRARLGARAGYLHVAVRLLADQGWVVRTGTSGTDELVIEMTRAGRAATALAHAYVEAAGFLPRAERLDSVLFASNDGDGARTLARFRDRMRAEWGLDRHALPVHVRLQVLHHLDGHVVAPVMASLARRGVLHPRCSQTLDLARLDGDADALPAAFGVLAHQGWATVDGRRVHLTAAGLAAAATARQYWYPASYLRTFGRVRELLFGEALPSAVARDDDHLDRELDIAFSGAVFSATCREPFLATALPIFDQSPVEAQPTAVVDTGCGDGALLEILYERVRARTRRGGRLHDRPLLMVGADTSPVARRTASARLTAAGIPHAVVAGDIADPQGLARTLDGLGLDPAEALHVSKSVIHNRSYRGSAARVHDGGPRCAGAFAAPDGSAIPAPALVADLVDHLRSWRELSRRHGLLVIEAHAVDPATATRHMGRTIATVLDATHGYSNQYPVEPDVFLHAARQAGLHPRTHVELGARRTGHAVLTIDHFVHA